MKKANLQSKTISELKEELINNRKELFNLRFQKTVGQLQNTARISIVGKNIARIKTFLTAKNTEKK